MYHLTKIKMHHKTTNGLYREQGIIEMVPVGKTKILNVFPIMATLGLLALVLIGGSSLLSKDGVSFSQSKYDQALQNVRLLESQLELATSNLELAEKALASAKLNKMNTMKFSEVDREEYQRLESKLVKK